MIKLAVVAAMMAISYQENLAYFMATKKFPEVSNALALVVIFAVVYFGISYQKVFSDLNNHPHH